MVKKLFLCLGFFFALFINLYSQNDVEKARFKKQQEENNKFWKQQVEESIENARIIVEGVVEKQKSEMKNRDVITYNYIRITNSLENQFEDKLLCLMTMGGEVGGNIISYSHGPKLFLGEKGMIILDSFNIIDNIVLAGLGYSYNKFFTNNGTKDVVTSYFYPYRYAKKLSYLYCSSKYHIY